MFLLSDKLEDDALVTWRALLQKVPGTSKERLLQVQQVARWSVCKFRFGRENPLPSCVRDEDEL